MNNKNFTTELFADRTSAEKAYDQAIAQGYSADDINVMMSDDSRKKYYDSELVKNEVGDKAMEGLAIGGTTGGIIGGTLGAIAAIGTSLIFPGLGLVVAGPIVAGLAGAGAGGISGGLIGALIGWGIPEEKAQVYEKGIKSGGIVLGVIEDPNISTDLKRDWEKYRSHSSL
jgi:hypothetical protein